MGEVVSIGRNCLYCVAVNSGIKMSSKNGKDIRALIGKLINMGIRVEGGGITGKRMHHYKVYPPDKAKEIVIISCSCSDFKVIKHIKADLKRSGIIIK